MALLSGLCDHSAISSLSLDESSSGDDSGSIQLQGRGPECQEGGTGDLQRLIVTETDDKINELADRLARQETEQKHTNPHSQLDQAEWNQLSELKVTETEATTEGSKPADYLGRLETRKPVPALIDLKLQQIPHQKTKMAPITRRITENMKEQDDDDDELCAEYRDDIWKNLLKQEEKKMPFFMQSPELSYRGSLVQRLRAVSRQLDFGVATLHRAVALLDHFMDGHRLRATSLLGVALACLSIAAKTEEKYGRSLSLRALSAASNVTMAATTFRQIEFKVAKHAKWSLMHPTPETFAAHLSHLLVREEDMKTRDATLLRRCRVDAAKLRDDYLDLSLSNVRLKAVESVLVGCACVACARAELGLQAWPAPLEAFSGRKLSDVAPVTRLLHRMMQVFRARQNTSEEKQACSSESSVATPSFAPSPDVQVPLPSESNTSTDLSGTGEALDKRLEKFNAAALKMKPLQEPPLVNTSQKANNEIEYSYIKVSRLLETNVDPSEPSTSTGIKRSLYEPRKGYCVARKVPRLCLPPPRIDSVEEVKEVPV